MASKFNFGAERAQDVTVRQSKPQTDTWEPNRRANEIFTNPRVSDRDSYVGKTVSILDLRREDVVQNTPSSQTWLLNLPSAMPLSKGTVLVLRNIWNHSPEVPWTEFSLTGVESDAYDANSSAGSTFKIMVASHELHAGPVAVTLKNPESFFNGTRITLSAPRFPTALGDLSDVYLIIGDSQAVGKATIESGIDDDYTGLSNVLQFASDANTAIDVVQSTQVNDKPFGDGVVAYYDFSNPTDLGRDVSGNGLHGFQVGVVHSTDRGNSITFSQSAGASLNVPQRVELTRHLGVFKKLSKVSVSGWFKSTYVGSGVQMLIGFANDNQASHDWLVYTIGNKLTFQLRSPNGSIQFSLQSGSGVCDGNWHHFVASSGEAGNYLYLDNVQCTTYTAGNATNKLSINDVTINKVCIGANKDSKTTYEYAFNGSLADFMIFSQQIPASTIALLFADNYGYDVYALTGQSNQAGRGTIVTGIDDDYSLLGRVFQFPYDVNGNSSGVVTGTTISQAINPLDHISSVPGGSSGEAANCTGLWKTCFEIVAANTRPVRRRILLVPAAKGGTSFNANNWNPGNPIYTAAVNSINQAMSTHPWNDLKGILWHQGESDADAQNANHLARLNSLYDGFKSDIWTFNDSIPFIVGGIRGSSAGATWINNINNNLISFATAKKNAVFVPTSDLVMFDAFHFDAPSLRTLGERYANVLLEAIGDQYEATRTTAVTGSAITAAVNPLNHAGADTANTCGFWRTTFKRLNANDTILVPGGKLGSSLTEWKVGPALTSAIDTLNRVFTMNPRHRLCGVLAIFNEVSSSYFSNISEMYDALKAGSTRFNDTVPFILAGASESAKAFCNLKNNCSYVDTSDLSMSGADIDGPGLRLLGERIADGLQTYGKSPVMPNASIAFELIEPASVGLMG